MASGCIATYGLNLQHIEANIFLMFRKEEPHEPPRCFVFLRCHSATGAPPYTAAFYPLPRPGPVRAAPSDLRMASRLGVGSADTSLVAVANLGGVVGLGTEPAQLEPALRSKAGFKLV